MIPCSNCENGLVYQWSPTRHGWETHAQACDECGGSGRVEEPEGDERGQPHRDSGLPTFEQVEEWKRLR